MNWSVERINDHNNLTTVEMKTRSRQLNSYTLFMMNNKNELSQMSSAQRLEWQRNNSPRYVPNIHVVNNNNMIMLQRRVNRTTQQQTTLTIFNILKNLYRNLDNEVVIALRNRSRFLNERDPHINIDLDDNVFRICETEMQHKILTISWLNMEKLLHSKLARSNRNNNQGGVLCDRYSSLPHKVKMKRQIFIKMNLDLSLMFYLFGADLTSTFTESERTFILEKNPNVKIFHIKSLRRINDIFSTSTSDCICSNYTYKTTERWHYCAAKVSMLAMNSKKEKIGYVIDEENDELIVEYSDENDVIFTTRITSPEWDAECKEYIYKEEYSCEGVRIILFEPIVLRFSLTDPRANFWFFSNRYTKTRNHLPNVEIFQLVNDLKFDVNYCS